MPRCFRLSHTWFIGALVAGFLPCISWPCAAHTPAIAPNAAETRVMHDLLIIDRTGRGGRSPVHIDAIEAQIVAGIWRNPKPGDIVTVAHESVHRWTPVTVDQNGVIEHESLQGGYACWTIEYDQPGVMLLRASGHNCVYVNGEIRTGDPYSNGIVQLPVQLKKGENTLLFQCSRGRLAAQLVSCPDTPFFNADDVTLPDLIVGRTDEFNASIVVVNPRSQSVDSLRIEASVGDGATTRTDVGAIPPLGVLKAGFTIKPPSSLPAGPATFTLRLIDRTVQDSAPIATQAVTINCVQANQLQRRTYISSVDGSVQYWALLPANPPADGPPPWALILTLHGADVEATNQAAAYAAKSWAHIIAPTNRRKYGFDWEDWGRIDAMDVLDLAQHALGLEGQRVYLTGHSMGGHGTWQIGATFPNRFLAIGPSAGWISFWSYADASRLADDQPIERMFRRASNPSDTLSLSRNYLHQGVYILHGDQDDNVPVDQARQMRKLLGEFHPDFAYFEQPGAGHWWGSPCVDWPPMMQFFQEHRQSKDPDHVEFVTANPGDSSESKWARIESQIHPLEFSSINLHRDGKRNQIIGSTVNVKRMSLVVGSDPAGLVHLEIDGGSLDSITALLEGKRLLLERTDEKWKVIEQLPKGKRSLQRNGPFKDVFRNRMILVYGTHGSEEENAWALHKARYDAETFWYRGNGSVEIRPDTDLSPSEWNHRNVILYGNADINSAWNVLLVRCPVRVNRGNVSVGSRTLSGDDLAVLFIWPRDADESCCIGVISGTGLNGMRLTDRLSYFQSGVAYPDATVLDTSVLRDGLKGVRAAGYFGDDWSVESGDFDWNTE